jgi:two-component system, chemotaxis family, response regulator Rcp1
MPEILLAEDNPADVYLIREALKEHAVECTVRTAADGKEVLALISAGGAWNPDLIILDLNLPRHDGIEILQKLRSTEGIARASVVVLTSSDSPRDRQTANELGATRYVRKPSNLEEFLQLGALFKELLAGPAQKGVVVPGESTYEG